MASMATKKNTRTTTKKTPTATKKAAPRRSTATHKKDTKKAVPQPAAEERTIKPISEQRERNRVQMKRSYIIIALSVLVLLGLLYLLRSVFVAAMVNGQPITRLSVVRDLEKQSGKQALDTIITKTLITQEAKKEHVTVSQSEIDAEMKKIEDNVKQQGQTLDQVLASQGMDRSGLEDQIRVQKEIEKMLGKNITVTDKEVNDYIAKNKDALGSDPTSQSTKDSVKQQLTQQKLSDKFQTWIQDLKKKAHIDYFVKY